MIRARHAHLRQPPWKQEAPRLKPASAIVVILAMVPLVRLVVLESTRRTLVQQNVLSAARAHTRRQKHHHLRIHA